MIILFYILGAIYWNILFKYVVLTALNTWSNLYLGFYKIPKSISFYKFQTHLTEYWTIIGRMSAPSLVIISTICIHSWWPWLIYPCNPCPLLKEFESEIGTALSCIHGLMNCDKFFKLGTHTYKVSLLIPTDFRHVVHMLFEIPTEDSVCLLSRLHDILSSNFTGIWSLWPTLHSSRGNRLLTRHSLVLAYGRIRQSLTALVRVTIQFPVTTQYTSNMCYWYAKSSQVKYIYCNKTNIAVKSLI